MFIQVYTVNIGYVLPAAGLYNDSSPQRLQWGIVTTTSQVLTNKLEVREHVQTITGKINVIVTLSSDPPSPDLTS